MAEEFAGGRYLDINPAGAEVVTVLLTRPIGVAFAAVGASCEMQ